MYSMRFDMRAPEGCATTADLFDTALDMCAWAESRGGVAAALTEHHMSNDGYLPSPLIAASAIAARTQTLQIMIAIIQLPLYNPVRLAEEICVLDNIARGRVSYVGGIGYVPYEYEMHGVEFRKRGAIAEAHLPLLLQGIKGEAFEHEGRKIRVTPGPYTPGGPKIMWGGGSVPAARRAGKYGLDFLGQRSDPVLQAAYDEACAEYGQTPGNFVMSEHDEAAVMFVADDVDAAWEEIGPYMMNDVLGYAQWYEGPGGERGDSNSISFAKTWQELRAENRSHVILTVEEAAEKVRAGEVLRLHPLIGGMPADIAWPYLRTVAEKVMPAAAS